jgi:hypothetical protein
MKRLPYNEGSTVAVPLRGQPLWASGIVARVNGQGIFLGYFFGPATPEPRSPAVDLAPRDAVAVRLCGDRGLLDGDWDVTGTWPNWDPDQWPMPAFHREIELIGQSYRITYADDLLTEASVTPISEEEAEGLPRDGILNAKAVEHLLNHELGRQT